MSVPSAATGSTPFATTAPAASQHAAASAPPIGAPLAVPQSGTMAVDVEPAAAVTTEQHQQQQRGVEETMALDDLGRNPTPASVVAAQTRLIEQLRAENRAFEMQQKRYEEEKKARDDAERAREAAEQERVNAERLAAEQAKKEELTSAQRKLEATMRAALVEAQRAAPQDIDDNSIDNVFRNFQRDLSDAGLDEQKMERVAERAAANVDLIVKASAAAQKSRIDQEQREIQRAISVLKPHSHAPFSVSGGYVPIAQPQPQPQQQQQVLPPLHQQQALPPLQQSSSSSSMSFHGQPAYGGGTHSASQSVPVYNPPTASTMSALQPPNSSEFGTYNASKPNFGIFGGILQPKSAATTGGKRSASEMSIVDGGTMKRSITESVPMNGSAQSTAAQQSAPDIDFTQPNWIHQVVARAAEEGKVLTETEVRFGGVTTRPVQMASATGAIITRQEQHPRLSTPYQGPITLNELDPAAFQYCVEQVRKVCNGPATLRPQVATLEASQQVAAEFARVAINVNQNQHRIRDIPELYNINVFG